MSLYYKSLTEATQRQYRDKLLQLGVDELSGDPFISSENWIDNVTKWPEVEFGQIYCYLVDSPGQFTRETLKAYRSLDAYNYYHSGWVHAVLYTKVGDNYILKAKVNRSQAVTEAPHEAWVCVNKDGTILTAHCTCMAGLGEVCSHVAAILFKIEASVRLGYTEVSCTSVPCQWNQNSTKKVDPVPVAEINFLKPKKSNFHIQTDGKSQPRPSIKFDNTDSFLEKLKKSNPSAVIFSVVDPKPNPPIPKPSLPPLLTALYNDDYAKLSEAELNFKCVEIYENIKTSQDEASNLENYTKKQFLSLAWKDHRRGRLTTSNFYDICHTNKTKPSVSLLRRIMNYSPCVQTPAIKWGQTNEKNALEDYKNMMKKHNSEFTVSRSGLVVNPLYPILGASPDGVTECPCCGKGLVEVKCPYKYMDTEPCSVMETGFYLKPHLDKTLDIFNADTAICENSLKNNSKYYYQVQGQMAICDVKFCDFVCWSPNGMHVERIYQDFDFFQTLLKSLNEFFIKTVLPEILTKRMLNSVLNDADTTHCVCGRPEDYDNMIGCDSGHCKVEWYHFKCVGLKCAPEGSWQCLACRKMPSSKKQKV